MKVHQNAKVGQGRSKSDGRSIYRGGQGSSADQTLNVDQSRSKCKSRTIHEGTWDYRRRSKSEGGSKYGGT